MTEALYSIEITRAIGYAGNGQGSTYHSIEIEPALPDQSFDSLKLMHNLLENPVNTESYPVNVYAASDIEDPFTGFEYRDLDDDQVMELSLRVAKFLEEKCFAAVKPCPVFRRVEL